MYDTFIKKKNQTSRAAGSHQKGKNGEDIEWKQPC